MSSEKQTIYLFLPAVNDQKGSRDNNVSIDCEVEETSTKSKSVSSKAKETDSVCVVYDNNGKVNQEELAASACFKGSGTCAKSCAADEMLKENENQPTNTISILKGRIKEQKEASKGASGTLTSTKAEDSEGENIADDVYLEGNTFTKLPFATHRSR